jgi:hypothetical protein
MDKEMPIMNGMMLVKKLENFKNNRNKKIKL